MASRKPQAWCEAGLFEDACEVWPANSPQGKGNHGATGHLKKRQILALAN
jgi:hypothetical protein